MNPRIGPLLILLLIGLAGPGPSATAGDNLLVLDSEPGDWLGQGDSHVFHSGDGTFSSLYTVRRGFRVRFEGSGHWWTIEGSAGRSRRVTPGAYVPALDGAPSFGDTLPSLDVGGDGRGCNSGYGLFDVRQIAYDAGGTVSRLHLLFEYHCDDKTPALTGELRLDADTSVLIQAPLRLRARRGQTLAFPIAATAASGSPPQIVAASFPAGASLVDHGNGTADVAWTPAIDQQGDFVLGFTASNGLGDTALAHTVVRVDGDTLLDVVSEPGDRAWLGQSCRLRPGDMTVTAYNSNGVGMGFLPRQPGVGNRYFAVKPLRRGNYSLLRRWSDEAYAGGTFIASPAPGSCWGVETHFRVRRSDAGQESLTSFWVEWEQHCNGEVPAFRGEIRLNTGSPIVVYAPIARRVHFGDTLRFGVMARDTLGRQITLSAWPLPAGASFAQTGPGTGEFLWATQATDNGAKTVHFVANTPAGQADTVATDILVTGDFTAELVSEPGDRIGGGAAVQYDGEPGMLLTTSFVSDPWMGNIDAVNLFQGAIGKWSLRLRSEPLKAGLYRSVSSMQFQPSWTSGIGARWNLSTDFRLRRVERSGLGAPLRYWLEFESRADDLMPIFKGEIRQDIRWRVAARAPLRQAAVCGSPVRFEVSGETPDGEVPSISVISMPERGVFDATGPGRGAFTWIADPGDLGALRTVAFRAVRQDGTSDTAWTALEALPTGTLHVAVDGVPLDLDTRLGQFRSTGGYWGDYITYSSPLADTTWMVHVHAAYPDTLRNGRYTLTGSDWDPRFCIGADEDFYACESDTGSFVLGDLERSLDYRINRVAATFSIVRFRGPQPPVTSSGWLFIGEPGGVDVEPSASPPAEFRMLGVWPNPSSRDGRVHLSLPRSGTVQLTLFDVGGRRIAGRQWRALGPGAHALEVPGNGAHAPGLYFLEARFGESRAVDRVVVLP